MENNFLENYKKRYSCKTLSTEKKISKEDLDEILEVVRLAPSMLNTQPWKIFVVEDVLVKQKLQEFSGWQDVVSENSHYLIFARRKNFDEKFLDSISKNVEKPDFRKEKLKEFFSKMDKKETENWAISQVSLALWNVIAFLSEKWIDSCPIWVFNREKYDEILWLDEKWFASVFNIAIGYSTKPKIILKKDRLEKEEIVEYLDSSDLKEIKIWSIFENKQIKELIEWIADDISTFIMDDETADEYFGNDEDLDLKNFENWKYKIDEDAEYGVEEIKLLLKYLDEFLHKAENAKTKAEAMKVVKEYVLKLNDLNEKCNHSIIETEQREDICEVMILALNIRWFNPDLEDVTEEWRDF